MMPSVSNPKYQLKKEVRPRSRYHADLKCDLAPQPMRYHTFETRHPAPLTGLLNILNPRPKSCGKIRHRASGTVGVFEVDICMFVHGLF